MESYCRGQLARAPQLAGLVSQAEKAELSGEVFRLRKPARNLVFFGKNDDLSGKRRDTYFPDLLRIHQNKQVPFLSEKVRPSIFRLHTIFQVYAVEFHGEIQAEKCSA